MNRNAQTIREALDSKRSLAGLKLDTDYRDFELTGREISGLDFGRGEFVRARFSDVTFHGCVFSNCYLERTRFERCRFVECRFDNSDWNRVECESVTFSKCSWENLIFEKCAFREGEMERCRVHDVDFYQTVLSRFHWNGCEFERFGSFQTTYTGVRVQKTRLVRGRFDHGRFEHATFFESVMERSCFTRVDFESTRFETPRFDKVRVIRCRGIPEDVLEAILAHGGRNKSVSRIVFGNPFMIALLALALLSIGTLSWKIARGPRFVYLRYMVSQAWKDPFRVDLSNEMSVLWKATFRERRVLAPFNRALRAKRAGGKDEARRHFLECLSRIGNAPENRDLYFWMINEILLVTGTSEQWENAVRFFERMLPDTLIQEMRLYLVKIFVRNSFTEPTLEAIQRFLIDSRNDLEMDSRLVAAVNEIPPFYHEFKPRVCQVLRSFLIRKMRRYPDLKHEYRYMKANVEEWLEYYESEA